VKCTEDHGIIDDNDFRRGHPQQDNLIMDDCAKGHSSKMEKNLPKKEISPGNYQNTPRKGQYAVSSNLYAFKKPIYKPGVVAHTFNSSTREAEAGGFLSSKPAWSTE
jgi:terminal uridylyltransferase